MGDGGGEDGRRSSADDYDDADGADSGGDLSTVVGILTEFGNWFGPNCRPLHHHKILCLPDNNIHQLESKLIKNVKNNFLKCITKR